MRLVIVAENKAVGVDGEFFELSNLPQLDAAIHAIQWYGEYGEIEYKTRFENGVLIKPANLLITDVTPYQFAVDAWSAEKTRALAEREAVASAFAQKQAQAGLNAG
jgi:hypothetical protein